MMNFQIFWWTLPGPKKNNKNHFKPLLFLLVACYPARCGAKMWAFLEEERGRIPWWIFRFSDERSQDQKKTKKKHFKPLLFLLVSSYPARWGTKMRAFLEDEGGRIPWRILKFSDELSQDQNKIIKTILNHFYFCWLLAILLIEARRRELFSKMSRDRIPWWIFRISDERSQDQKKNKNKKHILFSLVGSFLARWGPKL